MSLPWFPFNVKAYVTDTMRLTTEAHGAYLLLMLDYYSNEAPAPDDDEILSAITKLPVEVWQTKHRKVLAPFFQVTEGRWHHERIEDELRKGQRRYEQTMAATEAAKRAREVKKTGTSTSQASQRTSSRCPKRSTESVPKPVTSIATSSLTATQEQEHPSITEGERSPA